MGGKNSAPKPPDYSQLAAASEASAERAFELGQDQLAWAKEQYGQDREIIDRVVNAALERQGINDAAADRDRARYEDIFQPIEEDLARDAEEYSSPERQRLEMERAQSSVAQQFEAQRRAAVQNLEAFGVDPSSTRFAALDSGSRVAQAAAAAGAGNQARQQSEAIGRALRSEAINVGRGYPGQVAGTYATALQSGNQAVNSQLAGTASGANTMGTGVQWQGLGNQGLNTWGNTLNASYQNQLAQYNANQQSSSGIGGLFGAGIGLLGTSTQGTLLGALNEGGMVDNVTTGGNVPTEASPSRGQAIDDVDARLTAGEFVVPKDVVQWKGEEFFQKLIDNSRKAKPEAPAQPEVMAIPQRQQQPPAYVSRPSGALPVR